MSKYALIGCLLQTFFYPFLFAESTKGQKSLENIFVTIELNESKLKEVFTKIEKLTDFQFAYKKGEIRNKESLSINARDISIGNLLRQIARETNLKFKRVNEIIHVTENSSVKNIVTEVQLPDRQIRGKVTDENGSELPGVNVLVKDTGIGTITDLEGNYSLNVPDDATILVFSYVGYITEEVDIAGRTTVDFVLTPDIETLAEVVVVGYGTQRRETLSGSVVSLDNEVLENIPINSTLQGIQGRLAGAVVTRGNGQPGSEGFNIQIRGASTVNGNSSPLIIIDGVPGSMADLNPNDVENFTVLKDASAAIYGARASNGVILVTTKKGTAGKPTVNVNTSYSLRRRADFFEQLNSYQVIRMGQEGDRNTPGDSRIFELSDEVMEALRNETGEPFEFNGLPGETLYAQTWDYTDMSFDVGSQSNTDVNISGATDKFSYRGSFGFLHEDGILKVAPEDNNQRANARFNLGFRPIERLNIESRIGFSRQVSKRPSQLGIGSALTLFPFMRPYTVADPTKYATTQGYTPPMQFTAESGTTTDYDTRIENNVKVDYEVVDNLTVTGQVGANLRFREQDAFLRRIPNWDEETGEFLFYRNNPNTGTEEFVKDVYSTLIGYVNYSNTFAGIHDLSVTAGASHEQFDRSGFWARRIAFPSNDFFSLNLGDSENQTNNIAGGDGKTDENWTIRSLFGRASYMLNSKYIVELNTRYDGSSRFARDTRWGFFWGASAAWRLGEESFVQNLNVFDALKLRLSYSETGSQEGIGLYDYIETVSIGGQYPFGDGARVARANVGNLIDPTRTWETVQTYNIGLDFAMLDNRLSGSFDYFVKDNVDMLVPLVSPALIGSPLPSGNNGELRTKGWEAILSWQDDIGSDFSYFININVDDAVNEVTDYGGQDTYSEGRVEIREGQMINTYHGWVFDGIIRNQQELDDYKAQYLRPGSQVPAEIGIGDARYKDVNGDGLISVYGSLDENGEATQGDVVPLGNPTPRYNFGVNLGFNYKGFEFSAFLQGVGQKEIFLDGDWSAPFFWWWHKPDTRFWNTTWSPERPDAPYPRISHGNIRRWNYNKSTLTMLDASYMRLKNVTIGYNLPKSVTNAIGVERLKVYISGFDLWERHDLPGGFDPESLTFDQTSPQQYPFSRLYTLGVNVTF